MPTSSNGGGSKSACTELDFLLGLDAIFAIFCAIPNTPRDIAEPDLFEAALSKLTFDATADIPPMTTPESLQEAAADCGPGNVQEEGTGKAPDMAADSGLFDCLRSLAGDMAAHSLSGRGVWSLLAVARVSGIISIS
jgi:hypothetical protein